jgi:hypothetical protein
MRKRRLTKRGLKNEKKKFNLVKDFQKYCSASGSFSTQKKKKKIYWQYILILDTDWVTEWHLTILQNVLPVVVEEGSSDGVDPEENGKTF